MPAFASICADAFAQVDALFGEQFIVTPYAEAPDKRAAPSVDTTRPVLTLQGLWVAKSADPREPNAYDPREYRRPGSAGDLPTVEFSPAALGALVNPIINVGDHIQRVETGQNFLAQTPVPSANGTLRIRLNAL